MSNIIFDIEELKSTVDYFQQKEAFIFDVETMGDHRGMPHLNRVVWLSMATHGMTKVIPMGHPNGDVLISRATKKLNKETKKFLQIDPVYDEPPEQLRPSEVFTVLEPLFFNPNIVKGAHNMSFDFPTVAKYFDNRLPAGPYTDTIVERWLLDENIKQFGLKDLTKRDYSIDYDQEEVGKRIEWHPFWKVAHYAYMDAKYTWLQHIKNTAKIQSQDLVAVYELEQNLMPVIADIRMTGSMVDYDALVELHQDLEKKIEEVEAEIYRAAGQKFNINSNPQKQKILFGPKEEGGQGLKPVKFTDGGKTGKRNPSTAAEALEEYVNPVTKGLLDYGELGKLQNSFVAPYLGYGKKELMFDGRMYPEFVQYGTTTGRMSCRNPNLQQVPRPDNPNGLGKRIRNLFIPPPGYKLIVADWGQVELLIIAHYSNDPALVQAFKNDLDPHAMTAHILFNLPCSVEDVKNMYPLQRQIAKTINFAIAYGAGPAKLALSAGVSLEEAKRFSDMHEQEFKDIYRWKRETVRECRTRRPPYVTTILGRKRRLPLITSNKNGIRFANERQAVNSRIQGSQADLMKIAAAEVYSNIQNLDFYMNLSLMVHDETVTICPEERIDEGVELIRNAMTGHAVQQHLSLPLKLDLKVVDKWGDAK